MIDLDQTQTKHHASSALMVCLMWKKFVALGRLGGRTNETNTFKTLSKQLNAELTLSKQLARLYGVASKPLNFKNNLLMSIQVRFTPIFEDLAQNHAWYRLKNLPHTFPELLKNLPQTCPVPLKTCPRPAPDH